MCALKGIPGPLRLPVVGNLHLYKLGKYKVEEYHEVLGSLYRQYGPVVRVQLGPPSATIVHLFDPEHAELVHSREGKMPFVKPLQATVQQYRQMREKSPGLGNTNGAEWYRLRSAVRQVMLRPQEVQNYLPMVNEITDEMILRMKRKVNCGEVERLRNELSKWSREVAGWICFGRRLGSMDGTAGEATADKIIDANRVVFRLNAKLKFSLPLYKYISVPAWKQLVEAEDVITNHGLSLVEEAIESLKSGRLEGCQFLQYLLARPELSDRDVSIITLSLFTDGLSTMVPTLLCCLYCLAANPAVQQEAFEEVQAAVGSGDVTTASLGRMPFLKAVVKEVFRLYPNGVETDRVLQTDHHVGPYHLPAGTNVTMNQLVHFRSEKYFEQPEKLLPHRWLRDGSSSTSPVHSFLLLPFGYGSRSCIGRRFAEQDLYVSLTKFLLNFELSVPPGPPLKLIYETLLFPREPLRIQFKLR